MTKDELRRKYLLQSSTPTVQRLLQLAFQEDDRFNRTTLIVGSAVPALSEARRLYDEYHTELVHYQPVATASAG
jgi:hypothetical protein